MSLLILIREDAYDAARPKAETFCLAQRLHTKSPIALGTPGRYTDRDGNTWLAHLWSGAHLRPITAQQVTNLTDSYPVAVRDRVIVALDKRPEDFGLTPVAGEEDAGKIEGDGK